METSKFNDKIDITIKDDYSIKDIFFDLKRDDKNKYKDLRQTVIANNKYKRLSILMIIINNPAIMRSKNYMTLTFKVNIQIFSDINR